MRRLPAPQEAASVSLFPFLAVLLCTMGALILLLIVIARQAQLQVAAASEPPPVRNAEADEERQAALDMIQWRIDQLASQREQTEQDLAARRLELGHLEEHARQLRDQLDEIRGAMADVDRAQDQDADQVARMKDELRRLHDQVTETQRRLNAARRQAGSGSRSFAVVPYQGPNQTRRRPVYIECRADGIFLQPENIRLTEEDFQGPLGPGNPLAAALRAAREHLAAQSPGGEGAAEPYPLLLVRPSGIVAYYVAREALQSWGSDFGYELVDEDWELAYQPPDPQLEVVERRAVETARQRLRQMAMAVPLEYGVDSRPSFAVPPGEDGKWVSGGLADGGGRQRSGYRSGTTAGGTGSRLSSSGGLGDRGPLPDEQRLPAGARDGLLTERRGGAGGVTADSLEAIYGGVADGSGRSPAGASSSPSSGLASSPSDLPGGSGNQSPSQQAGGGTATGGGDREFPSLFSARGEPMGGQGSGGTGSANGQLAGTPNASSPQSGMTSTGTPKTGTTPPGTPPNGIPPQPGTTPSGLAIGDANQRYADSSAASGSPGGTGQTPSDSTAAGQTSPQAGAQAAAGSASMSDSPTAQGTPSLQTRLEHRPQRELAEARGRNWALPENQRGSVGITRPIRIECRADRLVLLAENNATIDHYQIELGSQTADAVDELVVRVWDRMEGWGMAGRGMHWRPVLQLDVHPDGTQRAQDLKDLLANSGLGISENLLPATWPAAQQPSPAIQR